MSGPSRAALRASVRHELLERTARLALLSTYTHPASTALVVALLWSATDHRTLAAWWAAAIVIGILNGVLSWLALGVHRNQRHAPAIERSQWVAYTAMGAVWGVTPALLDPGPGHADMRALLLVVLIGVAATQAITTAGSRGFLAGFEVALLVPAAIGLGASGERSGAVLAAGALLFLGVTVAMHHVLHDALVTALGMQRRNDDLLGALQAEHARLEEANTELVDANAKLAHRATHDDLSGLANRTLLLEHLAHELHHLDRYPDEHTSLVLFDLDRFKAINDTIGHAGGDELLRAVAPRIGGQLRAHDVLARLGGDEFAVLLPRTGRTEALRIAERLRAAVAGPLVLAGRTVHLTASFGVAVAPADGTNPTDLLRHADAALYEAKDAGRNRVASSGGPLRARLARQADDEHELRRAIEAGHIEAWFQPEYALATGALVGAEALARWRHPSLGIVPASAFIATATEANLLRSVTATVVAQTMEARAHWARIGVRPDLRLRLNVPAEVLLHEEADAFEAMLARTGCPPTGLSVEVTESSAIRDPVGVASVLSRLRHRGITVALDDFGTGYASLSLLRQLPLDGVKIDRSFVRDMVEDPDDRALIACVLDLGRHFGLTVTAEGVETTQQADLLRSMGCHNAQGYLWSEAVPPDAMLARALPVPAGNRR